jgi:hypothetical protein
MAASLSLTSGLSIPVFESFGDVVFCFAHGIFFDAAS